MTKPRVESNDPELCSSTSLFSFGIPYQDISHLGVPRPKRFFISPHLINSSMRHPLLSCTEYKAERAVHESIKNSRFRQLRRCMFQALIRCVCDRLVVKLAHGVSTDYRFRPTIGYKCICFTTSHPSARVRSQYHHCSSPLQSWQYETRPPLRAFVWQSAHMLPLTEELHPTGSSVSRY